MAKFLVSCARCSFHLSLSELLLRKNEIISLKGWRYENVWWGVMFSWGAKIGGEKLREPLVNKKA